jgi:hypothetical protein
LLPVNVLLGFCIKDIDKTLYLYNGFDIRCPIIVHDKIAKILLIDHSNPVGNAAMA